jgi:coenzyme F420-reducing hydrogenase delta subunit
MGVGPPGRTGRDQLAATRRFGRDLVPGVRTVVTICCDHGAGAFAGRLAARGAVVYPVGCTGNLHTSVIERLLRDGAAGVLILACPPRDCRHREGPRWLTDRVFHGREAELQPRVPRDRVRVAHASAREAGAALAALDAFTAALAALRAPALEPDEAVDAVCEPAEAPAAAGSR